MARAIKLNLDTSFEVFDLGPYPHLREVLDSHFDIFFLNGPLNSHPDKVTVGIAVDDEGLLKSLDPNPLACSLKGVFYLDNVPLVGPACVIASTWGGDHTDVPEWAVDLVTEIKRCTDLAHKHD